MPPLLKIGSLQISDFLLYLIFLILLQCQCVCRANSFVWQGMLYQELDNAFLNKRYLRSCNQYQE